MKNISDEIREYLARTHAYAWSSPTTPDEPEIVHAFLCDEMWPVFESIVQNRVISQTDIIIRGIFTHQTPTVKELNQPSGCELADLMLVRVHIPDNINIKETGRAVLMQAKHKEAPATESLNKDGDLNQFRLYQGWNNFTGIRRLSTTPGDDVGSPAWDFRGHSSEVTWRRTAEYLSVLNGRAFKLDDLTDPAFCSISPDVGNSLIKEHNWPNGTTWANGEVSKHDSAAAGVKCPNDFAETLIKFVNGNFGREFDAGLNSSKDHWSIFVAEMLSIATLQDYKFGGKRRTRVNSASILASLLPIISNYQIHQFIGDAPNADFSFINSCLTRLKKLNTNHPRRPIDGGEPATYPIFGHIPMLLMITYGEELRLV